jgi:hypothetical protein
MDAEARPFPSELTTPPVTKIYLAPIRLQIFDCRIGGVRASASCCALLRTLRALAELFEYRNGQAQEGFGTGDYRLKPNCMSTIISKQGCGRWPDLAERGAGGNARAV